MSEQEERDDALLQVCDMLAAQTARLKEAREESNHLATKLGEHMAIVARAREAEEDAKRYRLLSDAIGDEKISVYDMRTGHRFRVTGSLGLEALCFYLRGEEE